VGFDPSLLEVIPKEVIERDYGCGNPTHWVREGDTVLDLGSGSGKNAFICAQIAGRSGRVIGIDRNHDMLALARGAAPLVAAKLGFANVSFVEGAIEDLGPISGGGSALVADESVDLVLSNCVLNLVNPAARSHLLKEIRRVFRPGGRIAISDIVCDREVPLALQQDPELWSGCISGCLARGRLPRRLQGAGTRRRVLRRPQQNPLEDRGGDRLQVGDSHRPPPRREPEGGVLRLGRACLPNNRRTRTSLFLNQGLLASRHQTPKTDEAISLSLSDRRHGTRAEGLGCPTAAVMRRIWRFRPSLRAIDSHWVGWCWRTRIGS